MNATADRLALQAAVIANPMDRATRLVYADCLEESGDEAMAARQRTIAVALAERVLEVPGKLGKRVKATLGYKGRKVHLALRRAVTLTDRWYDGGTKSDWYTVDISTGNARELVGMVSPFNAGPDPIHHLTQRDIVCERVHFCGKDCGIRIYCHPDLYPELLD